MKRISFYAVRSDLLSVLKEIETNSSITYTLAENLAEPVPRQWATSSDIEHLGRAEGEQTALCRALLVTFSETPVNLRPVHLFRGGVNFTVDQLVNPDSIVLTPAGQWKSGIIIAGICATLSSSEQSQRLMRLFSKSISGKFTKRNAYWVGPEALLRLQNGWRLTPAEQSPAEYDLRLTM